MQTKNLNVHTRAIEWDIEFFFFYFGANFTRVALSAMIRLFSYATCDTTIKHEAHICHINCAYSEQVMFFTETIAYYNSALREVL